MKICFVNGPSAGRELVFALPEITVGREDGNVLRIPTAGVSRYHARFALSSDGRWMVCDQDSTNGVKVNGERISGERILAENDLVEIGEQILRVEDLSGGAPKVIFRPVVGSEKPELREVGKPDDFTPNAAPGTAVDDKRTAEHTMADVLSHGDAIFGGAPPSDPPPGAAGSDQPRRHRSLVFYAILFFAVLAVIFAVLALTRGTEPEDPAGEPAAPAAAETGDFALFFEKRIIDRDNVFRFALQVEDDEATFTVDDIKSLRHYSKTLRDAPGIRILRSKVTGSGIRACRPGPDRPGVDDTVSRRLVFADSDGVTELHFHGDYVPSAFGEVEAAVQNFAASRGLHTLMFTPEQLRQEAESSFLSAEDAFGNREASPENLRKAIQRYRVVINCLEQFSQPPAMLKTAREHLQEAEGIRKRKLADFRYQESRALNLSDTASLHRIYRLIMELDDLDGPDYRRARERLFILSSDRGTKR